MKYCGLYLYIYMLSTFMHPHHCPFRHDHVVRVLKLPTAPDDYAFMLAEDYDAAVQQQYHLMQVRLIAIHAELM